MLPGRSLRFQPASPRLALEQSLVLHLSAPPLPARSEPLLPLTSCSAAQGELSDPWSQLTISSLPPGSLSLPKPSGAGKPPWEPNRDVSARLVGRSGRRRPVCPCGMRWGVQPRAPQCRAALPAHRETQKLLRDTCFSPTCTGSVNPLLAKGLKL